MSKQIEAMKLALKTLEQWDDPFYKRGRAIAVLQEALAEQPAQQEPMAWLYPEGLKALQDGKCWTAYPTKHEDCIIPLYTTPQPPAQPLTGEQIKAASLQAGMQEHYMGFHSGFIRFARAIEAAHGITKGNT